MTDVGAQATAGDMGGAHDGSRGETGPLVLIGAGNMGRALLAGWLAHGWSAADITVVDPGLPAPTRELCAQHGLQHVPAISDVVLTGRDAATFVVAVKPAGAIAACAAAGELCAAQGVTGLLLSVAAGVRLADYQSVAGAHLTCVRTMPNTPASIGAGMTALCGPPTLTARQKISATQLMQAVGATAWLDAEGDLDAVTAVSGSGPGYIFHVVEALAKAGEAQGLAPELAMQLARQTVAGVGAMLASDPADAATLRENVTSPNGTTAAGLGVLMASDGGLSELFSSAVDAAAARSRELAG
ncbi:MAG: pyrroline-5-carboxylate reductase [Pseudomonadota bacterium]